MSTTDAGEVAETESLTAQHFEELLNIFEQNLVCLTQQITVCSVNNVGTCQTVVHPLALLAQSLADCAGEGHDIVAGLQLNLADASDIKRCVCAQLFHILCGNNAQLAPSLAGENLHLQVCSKLILFGPHGAHRGTTISLNHNSLRYYLF